MAEIEEKNRILHAAEERFLQTGIHKVTVDEIAADLQMSKKTVYKFFPSKDDLLKAIVEMTMRRVEREVHFIVSSERPFEEKMVALLLVIGTTTRKMGKQFQADMQRHVPNLWKEIETFRRERIFPHVRSLFEQAQREKLFREDMNLDLFFLIFLNTVQGIMNPQTLSQQSFSAEEAFKGIFKLLFEGALTVEARERFSFFETTFSDHQHMRTV